MRRSRVVRVNEFATRSDHADWMVIDSELLRQKARDAAQNARRREIHFFHHGDDDVLHRMLNCLQPGTYIRPHRHLDPPKDESFLVIQGAIGFVTFDDRGNTSGDRFALIDPRKGFYGVDARAGVWHTFLALEPDTVVFEVKAGPYARASDKDFASWAPAEGTLTGVEWLMDLEDRFRSIWKMPSRGWDAQASPSPTKSAS